MELIIVIRNFQFWINFAGSRDEPWNDYVPPPDTFDSTTQTEGSMEVQHSMLKGIQFVDSTGSSHKCLGFYFYWATSDLKQPLQ